MKNCRILLLPLREEIEGECHTALLSLTFQNPEEGGKKSPKRRL